MRKLPHAIRLLESGIDVISTNLFLNVGDIRGEVRQLGLKDAGLPCAPVGLWLHGSP